MSGNRTLVLLLLAGTAAFAVWPALAAYNTVAGLFQAGNYSDAREALTNSQEGARPGEDILWRSRMSQDPAEALALLTTAAGDRKLSPAVHLRVALEAADIEAGRGNHQGVMVALAPILNGSESALPGAVYLRAGLSLRALGQLQRAREMLASVRPNDPEFVLARYYLGDIALEQDDPSLALRYFKAAGKATDEAGRNRLAAGTWQTYRIAGEDDQAGALVRELAARDPGSLALLEIRRLLQVEADEQQARNESSTVDSVLARPADRNGRYALQLGAFSDRGLALEFVRRYHDRLPELRIDKSRDQRGQFLYKVRTGNYVNPALARSEARQLARKLGIEVITADLSTDSGTVR